MGLAEMTESARTFKSADGQDLVSRPPMNALAVSADNPRVATNLLARDQVARALLVLLHLQQVWRLVEHFAANRQLTDLPYIATNGFMLYSLFRRRPVQRADLSWPTRIAVAVGTYGTVLLRPIGVGRVPDLMTATFTSVGFALSAA